MSETARARNVGVPDAPAGPPRKAPAAAACQARARVPLAVIGEPVTLNSPGADRPTAVTVPVPPPPADTVAQKLFVPSEERNLPDWPAWAGARALKAAAAEVCPVPPEEVASVPERVSVPDVVMGPPENAMPVEPPEAFTDVTVPVPPGDSRESATIRSATLRRNVWERSVASSMTKLSSPATTVPERGFRSRMKLDGMSTLVYTVPWMWCS